MHPVPPYITPRAFQIKLKVSCVRYLLAENHVRRSCINVDSIKTIIYKSIYCFVYSFYLSYQCGLSKCFKIILIHSFLSLSSCVSELKSSIIVM